MNRRSFLQALGLAATVAGLSPMLDLAPIEPAVSAAPFTQCDTIQATWSESISDGLSLARVPVMWEVEIVYV